MFMQNLEKKSHLSPYVRLLCSVLLEWEERLHLLIGLFPISGEIPTTTTAGVHSPDRAQWGTFSGWCAREQ